MRGNTRGGIGIQIDADGAQILAEGHGDIGGAMQPPPQGVWGMPAEILRTLTGYGPDIGRNRDEARKIMEEAGY
jgi:peptide/nickel transport system substrate-binding protein